MRRLACLLAGHLPLTVWLDRDGRSGMCPRCLQVATHGRPGARYDRCY